MPPRHKMAMCEALLINIKFAPSQICRCLENKLNVKINDTEQPQASGCTMRQRLKLRENHEENAVLGSREFASNHKHHNNVVDPIL